MASSTHHHIDTQIIWDILRISLGFLFFWAFLDKFFGLGFTTCKDEITGAVNVACDAAVVSGGSPAGGFLEFAARGPLSSFYSSLAGIWLVDFLFMTGLFAIGLALIVGVGITIAVYSGILILLMMWSAILPPEHNPLIDEHIIYILVLIGVLKTSHKQKIGLGAFWAKTNLVKRFPILK